MNTVKIAVLRNETDRLFRLANTHYHACVGIQEIESWQVSAQRALDECDTLTCKRASGYDLEQFAEAYKALAERLAASGQRIAQLREETPPQRPKLRLISPCESYSYSDKIH